MLGTLKSSRSWYLSAVHPVGSENIQGHLYLVHRLNDFSFRVKLDSLMESHGL